MSKAPGAILLATVGSEDLKTVELTPKLKELGTKLFMSDKGMDVLNPPQNAKWWKIVVVNSKCLKNCQSIEVNYPHKWEGAQTTAFLTVQGKETVTLAAKAVWSKHPAHSSAQYSDILINEQARAAIVLY